ncbi:MAG: formate dehydrogenase-N subunit alpha [Eggerthellaceae bacterium]|nr:formate dehydrogenase-N subunit alpha [Eggerthellaceae bacterium]
MVRRPGASEWEEISWEEAISGIARHVKETRDATFEEKNDEGITVNRTRAIASFGGSQQNSEEEYLIVKLMRALGIVAIDNQARVCHSSTVAGVAPTFGRGSMTSHWCDIGNADYILICGSNCAENHPLSSKWINRSIDAGGTVIVVDPRYTRTAQMADIYCPIRSGTDIAFYGGMINYIIEHDLWQHEYVKNYTNAPYIVKDSYEFNVEDGLFSGWDENGRKYDTNAWGYETDHEETWDTETTYKWVKKEGTPDFDTPTLKVPKKDMTLEDPRCVWQLMKKHYSRYDLDTVSSVCGMDKDLLELVYKTYGASGAPEKSGSLLYALGQTQHSYGTQNTRIMSMVQLILGNIGVAGGGLNALRGEPNVQGATDMAMLVHEFPGYLKWPSEEKSPSLKAWLEGQTAADGYYTNKPKFFVSGLKEWFGENATKENDYGYDWLPKVPPTAEADMLTTIGTFELMRDGIMKGYFAWGMNPAHSGANTSFIRKAMANLDWLVVADWVETETATFWKAPDMTPADVQTEVYYLPAALIYEKSGTIANSGRWLQWRQKAVEPYDMAQTDYEMCDMLYHAIADLYEQDGGVCPEPITKLKWDYYIDDQIDPRAVAWALNGYKVSDGSLLKNFTELEADGSTSCAIWIYSGMYNNNEDKLNPAIQPMSGRGKADPGDLKLYPEWSFAWPLNRRIVYNRASCDMQGKPWSKDKVLVEWTGTEWNRNDVPDFAWQKTNEDGTKTQIEPNNKAFMMRWEQNACFITKDLRDAPFPEHYEPIESPTTNVLNGRENSPLALFVDDESVKRGSFEEYPIAVTTYSIVEHWQTGGQTRMCPALNEIAPDQFIEISHELAKEKGIKNGDKVRVFNNRGSVEMNAMVTERFQPMNVNGEKIHHAGMVHHWSWASPFSTGDTTNDLSPNVGDPNSYIPEYKAFLIDIEKA